MIKKIILLIAICTISQSFAQTSLNDYKYVIVPNKYEFSKETDEYQLNSLTEFLLKKYGFNAYLVNRDLPNDLKKNGCLALRADVLEANTMFKTKVKIQLKNCNDQIIFTSLEGESKKKQYRVAYNEALRNAFKNFTTINYKYVENKEVLPTNKNTGITENSQLEIEQLKEEIKALKKENKIEKKPVVLEKIKQEIKIDDKINRDENQLYAQGIDNGFQLVDKSPKVIYTIYYSGLTDVFIIKDRDATLYKIKEKWVIAEVFNGKLQVKALNIKF